ncbi:I78 family peptidase inhibitor [Salinicola avicenniae]|uniref:I78 family peptidase inhibitor n=1 Tax=Salinicola avicenniae TaxID=2916836 RepID=UPI002072B538|nr:MULTISPECIES: I78 family peptidase inhibitor [unclassified Salinicola]
MKIHGAAWLVAGLMLAGCSTAPKPDDAPKPPDVQSVPEDPCGAQAVGSLEGETLTDTLQQTIAHRSRAATLRVMEPGKAYTMDYQAERLNIRLDDERTITDLSCG